MMSLPNYEAHTRIVTLQISMMTDLLDDQCCPTQTWIQYIVLIDLQFQSKYNGRYWK